MIEVHPDPEHALSDGPQSLHFKEFEKLRMQLKEIEDFMKRFVKT
jgi:3-deoxy-7-phosphoheptulonate synthase